MKQGGGMKRAGEIKQWLVQLILVKSNKVVQ
jgi:hypothetical protein